MAHLPFTRSRATTSVITAMVNLDVITQISQSLYLPIILRAHGDSAGVALRSILDFIRKLYQHVAPETHSGPLIIFKTLDDVAHSLSSEKAVTFNSFETLAQNVTGPCTIQVLDSGDVLFWRSATADPVQLAQKAVVYRYQDRVEKFYAKSEITVVHKILPQYASNFCVPTFDELRVALERYESTMVRYSSCPILSEVWFDADRIFLRSKPERKMRQSLTQFLKVCLRGDVEVRPEQIVDESHPVDIKVTWFLSNRLALIEIKWLGHSRNAKAITTQYGPSRARAGAKQLANYLNSNASQAPVHVSRGYLVVIDGRRFGLNASVSTVSHKRGLRYANSEIPYNPEYHKIRPDFEKPIRMFAEPICR